MSTIKVVHNPSSRRGARIGARLRQVAETSGAVAERLRWLAITDLPPDAGTSAERVIAVGGDGTVNAACEWMRRTGVRAPIGIVPAGTGNNLARGLGVPLAPAEAIPLALEGAHTRPIDAITYRAGDDERVRLAVQTLAFGFPAEVAERYDRLRQRRWFRVLAAPLGPAIYRLLAFAGIRQQMRAERRGDLLSLRARAPGAELDETVFAIFIGNERSLGGNFVPCPQAEVDDGLLDLCLVRAGTGISYLKLFGAVARGTHLSLTDAVVYLQTGGPLEIELDRVGPLLADGDIWVHGDRFQLQVDRHAFSFVVPA